MMMIRIITAGADDDDLTDTGIAFLEYGSRLEHEAHTGVSNDDCDYNVMLVEI